MKMLIIALAATGVALAAAPSESAAAGKHYKKSGKSYQGRTHRKRFTRRDYNRLPIRVTRPPNTGHYIYQDYPLWAARAFEPRRTR